VCTRCAGFPADPWIECFPRIVEQVEGEERRYWYLKPFRHSLEFLKRRSIPSALDQAQEVDGHASHFCELLLALVHVGTYLPNASPELLVQFTQQAGCTRRKSGVISFRVPPNGITGQRSLSFSEVLGGRFRNSKKANVRRTASTTFPLD